jgi:manganese-dependent inorganic pyrophosphatase
MKKIKTVIIGHRNPDTDSCAAATGYAALKIAQGESNVIAASAGYACSRTEFLYKKFNTALPKVIEDISPKVKSIMNISPTIAYVGETLLDAMEYFRESHMSRIPITDNAGKFIGMISLFDLAERMFYKQRSNELDINEDGVVGRGVKTSLSLAAKSLHGKITSLACDKNELIDLNVYVGAMSIERLKTEVLHEDTAQLAIIVGDRVNLQEVLVESKIRLMIVTGNASIDLKLIKKAQKHGTSILQTPFDSATTVRRLKFSQPVESMTQKNVTTFSANEKISDIYHTIMKNQAENYPVCDNNNKLLGSLTKSHIDKEPPIRLILVDHNEIDQAVRGAKEVPIIEIMDHHRIAISPTDKPITVINDVVGSTSTLVCEQYRRFGIEPTPDIAGILMGGVITDTLLLRSPTSTERDKVAIEYLEQLSGINARQLLDEIFNIGSIIATEGAYEVIQQDKKIYTTGQFTFSVSQVEESGFEHFDKQKNELLSELNTMLEKENVKFASLLVTDIISENSLLLVAGKQNIINALPFPKKSEKLYNLPGILSRKKQLLPALLKILDQI